jgi:hypothetical protein
MAGRATDCRENRGFGHEDYGRGSQERSFGGNDYSRGYFGADQGYRGEERGPHQDLLGYRGERSGWDRGRPMRCRPGSATTTQPAGVRWTPARVTRVHSTIAAADRRAISARMTAFAKMSTTD